MFCKAKWQVQNYDRNSGELTTGTFVIALLQINALALGAAAALFGGAAGRQTQPGLLTLQQLPARRDDNILDNDADLSTNIANFESSSVHCQYEKGFGAVLFWGDSGSRGQHFLDFFYTC